METVTPDRPPQLNKTVCGCRCGRVQTGQVADDTGGRNDEDGASTHSLETLVASNQSEADAEFPASPDAVTDRTSDGEHAMSGRQREVQEMQMRLGDFLGNVDILRARESVVLGEELSLLLFHPNAFEGSVNSMSVEPYGSDDHSMVSSGVRSIRSISPGPGIGAWTEDVDVDLGMNTYHFRETPLRLTPQRRYCRGLVASHLVLHDA
jgi:hypothetical protein